MCATRKGMKRGLGGVYMQCCTLQCIHVPMPSWSYAQLCNWALIKFQLLKVKILFTSITDICFSRIKRQCRSPVMSSTSKMVFFCLFSSPLVRCQCHLFVCWSDRHDICPNLYCRIFRPKNLQRTHDWWRGAREPPRFATFFHNKNFCKGGRGVAPHFATFLVKEKQYSLVQKHYTTRHFFVKWWLQLHFDCL